MSGIYLKLDDICIGFPKAKFCSNVNPLIKRCSQAAGESKTKFVFLKQKRCFDKQTHEVKITQIRFICKQVQKPSVKT